MHTLKSMIGLVVCGMGAFNALIFQRDKLLTMQNPVSAIPLAMLDKATLVCIAIALFGYAVRAIDQRMGQYRSA